MEEVLDEVPPFVHLFIVSCGLLSVFSWRDDRRDLPVRQDLAQSVCIERSIGEDVTCLQSLQQFWHALQIMGL